MKRAVTPVSPYTLLTCNFTTSLSRGGGGGGGGVGGGRFVQWNMAVNVLSLSDDCVPNWAKTRAGLEREKKGSITAPDRRRTADGRIYIHHPDLL